MAFTGAFPLCDGERWPFRKLGGKKVWTVWLRELGKAPPSG